MKGIDISSNNHQGEIFNFAQVKAAGYDFVYVKATQGVTYLNPYLVADVRDAANNGLLVGIYHFYDNSGSSAAQAEFFNKNGIHQPVGEGHTDLSQFLTLKPVFDYEFGIPDAVIVRNFNTVLNRPMGLYVNRNFLKQLGGYCDCAFGWLAWPGWSSGLLPSVTAIVQTGQQQVQGIGDNPNGSHATTDIDVLTDDVTLILDVATPTTKEEETEMDSILIDQAGVQKLVSHVYTSNGHYLEVTRPVSVVGGHFPNDGTQIIDLTDAYPQITWH